MRAVGHVKQDQIYLMARVGIDAFELAPAEKPEEALATLARFKIAYTPGAPLPTCSASASTSEPRAPQRAHRSGSFTSLNSSVTSSADVSAMRALDERRSRCGASSCTKSYMYLRSSVPRRKPIHVVCAGEQMRGIERDEIVVLARHHGHAGDDAHAEPQPHIGLDHVRIARRDRDVGREPRLRERLVQRGRARRS